MNTLNIALIGSAIALAVLLIIRAVKFVRSMYSRQPSPPVLMRVGEVTSPPPPESRFEVQTKPVDNPVPPPLPLPSTHRAATETRRSQESVGFEKVDTSKGSSTVATAEPPVYVTRHGYGATSLFSVESLRDRSSAAEQAAVDPSETPLAGDTDYAFGKAFTPFFAAALPDTQARNQELKQDLVRAGYYQPHSFQNVQAVRWLFLIVPLLLLCVLINVLPQQVEFWLIITLVCVSILGWAFPKLYVASQASERRAEIERSLPDVLDMLNMCVSQGMTVIHALKRVTNELRTVFPALSQELEIVAEQAELGTLEQALINFSRRVDAPDVHSFTSLLIQTERMGTSVSAALGEYAENMRESLRQRADEKANKATFQLLFPTVLFLMPSVYIFLLGPSIIKLTEFFRGTNTQFQQQGNDNANRVNNLRPIRSTNN